MGDLAKYLQPLRQEIERVKGVLALQGLVEALEKQEHLVRQAEQNVAEMARLKGVLEEAHRVHNAAVQALAQATEAKRLECASQCEAFCQEVAAHQKRIDEVKAAFETKRTAFNQEAHELKQIVVALKGDIAGLMAQRDRVRADHEAFVKKVMA